MAAQAILPRQSHQRRFNLRSRPKHRRRQRAQNLHLGQKLHHHRQRPKFFSARRRPQSLGHFFLNGKSKQFHPGNQQLNDQRRGNVVRQIRDQLHRPRRCLNRRQKIAIQAVLRIQRVPFDQLESRFLRKSPAQQARQIPIDLHRNHLGPAPKQFLAQRPRPRANFNNQIPLRRPPRIGHDPQQILIDHEILPKPMPRRKPGLGEKRLNLLLSLHIDATLRRLKPPLLSRKCLLYNRAHEILRRHSRGRGRTGR